LKARNYLGDISVKINIEINLKEIGCEVLDWIHVGL
jgi:hypothetical protein